MTTQMQESLLAAPYGLQMLDLISQRQAASLTDDELNDLLTQLDFHVSRYRGDYDEYVAKLRSKAPQLQSLSGWLTQRMARWWQDLDRGDQVWLSPTSERPEPSRLVPDLAQFHSEAPKPKRAFWTSTQVPDEISPWLYWVTLGEARRPGPYDFWRVVVSPTARVAEIHSPEAWSALTRAYPSAVGGYTFTGRKDPPKSATRLDPDWSKVSRDWDGVHLSVGGWLTAEDAPQDSGGVMTELRGWNMESTAWFRWSFSSVEPLT
jgi:hypothetical protein